MIRAPLARARSTSPTLARTLAGLVQRRDQCRPHVGRIACGVLGRHIPFDRHRIERRLGLVPMLGDDGDAFAEHAAADQGRIGDRNLDRRDDAGLGCGPVSKS